MSSSSSKMMWEIDQEEKELFNQSEGMFNAGDWAQNEMKEDDERRRTDDESRMTRASHSHRVVQVVAQICRPNRAVNINRNRQRGQEKEMAAVATGVSLNHISRESSDVRRLADFYKEIFGLEEIESPNFGEFKVIWLKAPGNFALHLIERNPSFNLPEGPWSATSPVADPSHLPRGHHICFNVSNFQSFVKTLKEKGIQTFEKSLPDGKVKQVFFFDPDGNGLEAAGQ